MELVIDNSQHKFKAFGISTGLYALFLTALFFFKIIYEPKEEELALGVDLNYGIDVTGYGNIQTTNKANDSKNDYDVKPADNSTSQKEVIKPQPAVTPPPASVQKTPQVKTQRTPPVITSDAEESPVTMKKTPTTATAKVSESPAPSPPKPAPVAPARSVDQGSVMKKAGSGSNSNGTTGNRDGIGGNNNGDGRPGAVGDQGDPRGTPDGKSLYGNPGTGGGSGSSISGLNGWSKKPLSVPKDQSSETGRIVFRVSVDNRGEVISIVTQQSTVSPSVTDFYKTYIQRNLGRFLSPQGTPPAKSEGTITINITN
jgi:protein TonB